MLIEFLLNFSFNDMIEISTPWSKTGLEINLTHYGPDNEDFNAKCLVS